MSIFFVIDNLKFKESVWHPREHCRRSAAAQAQPVDAPLQLTERPRVVLYGFANCPKPRTILFVFYSNENQEINYNL